MSWGGTKDMYRVHSHKENQDRAGGGVTAIYCAYIIYSMTGKLGNACYHSVQNLLSSRLLSKNLKIKIYRTIIFPVVFYGCET